MSVNELFEPLDTTVLSTTFCEVKIKTSFDTSPCTSSNTKSFRHKPFGNPTQGFAVLPDYFRDTVFYMCAYCDTTIGLNGYSELF